MDVRPCCNLLQSLLLARRASFPCRPSVDNSFMRMVVCRITVEVKVQATRSALLQHLHRMDESFSQAVHINLYEQVCTYVTCFIPTRVLKLRFHAESLVAGLVEELDLASMAMILNLLPKLLAKALPFLNHPSKRRSSKPQALGFQAPTCGLRLRGHSGRGMTRDGKTNSASPAASLGRGVALHVRLSHSQHCPMS